MQPTLRRSLAALALLTFAAPAASASSVAIPIPGVRLTGGILWQATDDAVYGALDVLPNIEVVDTDGGMSFTVLLGYGYEGAGNHLFVAGADIGSYTDGAMLSGSLGLRGVIGSVDDELGGGVRVVAGAGFWYGIFRVEVGYQLLSRHDGASHDLRVTAGVDLIRMLVAPFLLMLD